MSYIRQSYLHQLASHTSGAFLVSISNNQSPSSNPNQNEKIYFLFLLRVRKLGNAFVMAILLQGDGPED